MVHFKVVLTPAELIKKDFSKMIKVLDIVGLWHYSRSVPKRTDYDVLFQGEQDVDIVIRCNRTRTHFKFTNDWKPIFNYINEDGGLRAKRPVEGQLFNAIDYVETLLNIGAIERHL